MIIRMVDVSYIEWYFLSNLEIYAESAGFLSANRYILKIFLLRPVENCQDPGPGR